MNVTEQVSICSQLCRSKHFVVHAKHVVAAVDRPEGLTPQCVGLGHIEGHRRQVPQAHAFVAGWFHLLMPTKPDQQPFGCHQQVSH